mmetsp:Transcript_11075/g.20716  ORF Transcript_11075/g.20716 Transcript_11075/m.20716 type:complete len:329 (-) Transcript_11075:84-1070(-)
MQLFSFLAVLTTADSLTWTSVLLGTSRHSGLEASAGYLHLTAPGQFEEPRPTEMLKSEASGITPVAQEEVPLEAEASEIAPGLDALQPQSENLTQTEPKASCSAELYQHGDFSGWMVAFPMGEYNHQQMVDKGAPNDDASSIKVIGPGCRAEVYEHGDFTGWKVVFSEGEYQHHHIVHKGVTNDALSAIKVFQGLDDELALANASTINTDTESNMQDAAETPAIPKPEDPRVAKIKSERSVEGNLIESLRHTGAAGDEAVECVTKCRYGETRLEWQDCLDWCVENPLMRSTMSAMLPKESHRAHAPHVGMPEILKRRQEHIKQRHSEL